MKYNKSLISYIVLFAFFVFTPKLVIFPFSSFMPKIIFGVILTYTFIIKKTKKIRLDIIVVILFLLTYSLFLTYLINGNQAVLNILLYSAFFFLILATGLSISSYTNSNNLIMMKGYRKYIILFIFLVLPVSVILQYIFPEIAHYYYQVVIYDEVLNESFEAIDGKYSGLTGGIGAGGSTALASMLILFEIINFYFFDNLKLFNWVLSNVVRMVYIISVGMCGTAGLILVSLYYISNYFFNARNIFLALWGIVLFFAVVYISLIFILPIIEIKGLSYLRVFIEEGFVPLLEHRSVEALILQYHDFQNNLELIADASGLFGNPNAIGYYDFTDIGFLNEINLIGLSGFILFNAYLFLCIITASKKSNATFFCKKDYVLRCALFSVAMYSFVFQFKEFSSLQGNGPQALAVIILVILFNIRKENFKKLCIKYP